MSPLPYETFIFSQRCSEPAIEEFLNLNPSRDGVYTTVVGNQANREILLQELGLPLDLKNCPPIEHGYNNNGREFRVFSTNRPNVYISQERKSKRSGREPWSYFQVKMLGVHINEAYRKSIQNFDLHR